MARQTGKGKRAVTKARMRSGKRLIVFDDDICLRNRLKGEMERNGYRVSVAGSIRLGSELLRIVRPSYAILDLKFADGSGLELVKELLQQNPKCRIVLLTGFGNIATAVAAVKAGAVDCLTKPASVEEILAALENDGKEMPPLRVNPMGADRVRWEHIQRIYLLCGGNISETARQLGMHRRTLQRLLKANPPRP